MSQFPIISSDPPRSYPQLVAVYGFLPNLFRAQRALPRAVEAEHQLIDAVVVRQGRLSRDQKGALLKGVASVGDKDYSRALFGHALPAGPDCKSALFGFSLQVVNNGPVVSKHCLGALKNSGL